MKKIKEQYLLTGKRVGETVMFDIKHFEKFLKSLNRRTPFVKFSLEK